MRRLKSLNNRGDTIVEVMIVLAVLGLAIGISFATANSSLLATRGAQENAQATAILQGQIESLRYMIPDSASNPDKNVLRTGDYCITDDYKVTTDATDSRCTVSDGRYHIVINYSSTTGTFTLTNTWDDIRGDGQDKVTLVYRLYQ